MPGGLGIWVSVPVSGVWLRWVVSGCGHAGGRRVVPGDGRFHGPAGVLAGLPVSVSAGQAGWLAMVMMAGAMRVRVSFAAGVGEGCWATSTCGRGAGSGRRRCGISRFPWSASRSRSFRRGLRRRRRGGAGVGDLAGPDGLPGAASLPGGGRGEGGVAGDAAGHLGAGGPGGEFLPDQARACRSGASARFPARAAQRGLGLAERGLRPVPPPL